MRVVAFWPKPETVQVVVIDGDADTYSVSFKEEWPIADTDRIGSYVLLRSRVIERVATSSPDAVCVAPFEPAVLKGKFAVHASSFDTAEVRGVVAEAARFAFGATDYRRAAAVAKAMGGTRKIADYLADDGFWSGVTLPKKYRGAALIAISWLKENAP